MFGFFFLIGFLISGFSIYDYVFIGNTGIFFKVVWKYDFTSDGLRLYVIRYLSAEQFDLIKNLRPSIVKRLDGVLHTYFRRFYKPKKLPDVTHFSVVGFYTGVSMRKKRGKKIRMFTTILSIYKKLGFAIEVMISMNHICIVVYFLHVSGDFYVYEEKFFKRTSSWPNNYLVGLFLFPKIKYGVKDFFVDFSFLPLEDEEYCIIKCCLSYLRFSTVNYYRVFDTFYRDYPKKTSFFGPEGVRDAGFEFFSDYEPHFKKLGKD